MERRHVLTCAFAASLFGLVSAANASTAYPNKPIRLVVPFAAGGGTDVVARTLAVKLGEKLGSPVVVDNRPGANGNIAAQEVSRANADGYTLLYNTSSLVLSRNLQRSLPYDYTKDLAPVIKTARMPLVLLVNPSVPASNLGEFIQYMKKNPGSVEYGSGGTGNISHLGMVQLQQVTGTSAIHVSYKGESAAMTDLASGQIKAFLGTIPTARGLVGAGRLKAIAIAGPARSATFEHVMSATESGVPAFSADVWQGVMAPAATPQVVINKINTVLNEVLRDPDVKARLAAESVEPLGSSPQEYADHLRQQDALWGNIIRAANIQPE
jgi:tripartite-type tricarboxylate transporter receptor subunit TctC